MFTWSFSLIRPVEHSCSLLSSSDARLAAAWPERYCSLRACTRTHRTHHGIMLYSMLLNISSSASLSSPTVQPVGSVLLSLRLTLCCHTTQLLLKLFLHGRLFLLPLPPFVCSHFPLSLYLCARNFLCCTHSRVVCMSPSVRMNARGGLVRERIDGVPQWTIAQANTVEAVGLWAALAIVWTQAETHQRSLHFLKLGFFKLSSYGFL